MKPAVAILGLLLFAPVLLLLDYWPRGRTAWH